LPKQFKLLFSVPKPKQKPNFSRSLIIMQQVLMYTTVLFSQSVYFSLVVPVTIVAKIKNVSDSLIWATIVM